ncbi:hypothetical protein J26TS2_34240 [Shouchella clausii]|nr:hypothetical protein J26TS2_34240 [Shouchella clausii]
MKEIGKKDGYFNKRSVSERHSVHKAFIPNRAVGPYPTVRFFYWFIVVYFSL